MVLLARIIQAVLLVWIARAVISRLTRARTTNRKPGDDRQPEVKRFDTTGKNVADGDYRDVR